MSGRRSGVEVGRTRSLDDDVVHETGPRRSGSELEERESQADPRGEMVSDKQLISVNIYYAYFGQLNPQFPYTE